MTTPAPLSPSTPQREQVIERLSRSFAEDAITMEEFERRAELVYRALTMADLQTLVADLPAVVEPADARRGKGVSVSRAVPGDRITTFLGSTERRMPASVPRQLSVRTMLGNTALDFRGSQFEPGITEVYVRCVFGNVKITVPDGVRVELLVSGVLANVGVTSRTDFEDGPPRHDTDPSSVSVQPAESILRITGLAVFASVEVHNGLTPREDH